MKISISSIDNKYLETLSIEDVDNINETFKKFSSIKVPLEAKIFAINESISSHKLSKIKNLFKKINISSIFIYSNNRYTVLAGNSLKINSTFVNAQKAKNNFLQNRPMPCCNCSKKLGQPFLGSLLCPKIHSLGIFFEPKSDRFLEWQ